ncbi:superoxide dismutase family protein [Ruminococcus sp.]
MAMLHGSPQHPEIHGTVSFYRACGGSLVVAELYQLPSAHGIFAMHIHSGASCTGTAQDAFADAGGHWELHPAEHPQHTGDLPALLSNDGYAWFAVYTNRFSPAQAVGKTVIIHADPDDYRTQPAGNAGARIACGTILA